MNLSESVRAGCHNDSASVLKDNSLVTKVATGVEDNVEPSDLMGREEQLRRRHQV